MPELNIIAVLVAALVPNVLGALYYGPLFGNQWLSSLHISEAKLNEGNKTIVYGLSLFLSIVVSMFIKMIIEFVHRDVLESGEIAFESFHTFGHGAMHGAFLCIGLVVPVIISLGLFHKAKRQNIILNTIFWILCFALMGGILDTWN